MGLFSRGIDIESGILFPEGWFRSGTRSATGRPTAEIYSLADKDDPRELWRLVDQEILSHTPRWKDDYFQVWAEILAVDTVGCTLASEWWIIVVFDPTGLLVTRVDYWPVLADGVVDDVAYADVTAMVAGSVKPPA